MNRPASRDFMLGHRTTVAASGAIAVLTTLSWLGHGTSWFIAGIALLFCKACFAAKRRVSIWQQWRGAWDEIANPATPATSPARPEQAAAKPTTAAPAARRAFRVPRSALLAAWLVLFIVLRAHQAASSTPALGMGALAFFALTLWGIIAMARNGTRWLFASSRRQPAAKATAASDAAENADANDSDGNAVVTCCLPMPQANPSRHVRELLPDYARALLSFSKGE